MATATGRATRGAPAPASIWTQVVPAWGVLEYATTPAPVWAETVAVAGNKVDLAMLTLILGQI